MDKSEFPYGSPYIPFIMEGVFVLESFNYWKCLRGHEKREKGRKEEREGGREGGREEGRKGARIGRRVKVLGAIEFTGDRREGRERGSE